MKIPLIEEKILKLIKDTEKSTTEISSFLNRNYYFTLKILEKFEKEKIIERIRVGKFTFWRIYGKK